MKNYDFFFFLLSYFIIIEKLNLRHKYNYFAFLFPLKKI